MEKTKYKISSHLHKELNSDIIRDHVSRWNRTEQAIFTAVFVLQKKRKDIAHDLGLPVDLLDEKIEELTRRLRINPK